MYLTTRYCPECGDDRPFDRPHQVGRCPDIDDVSGECPELACTGCGLAMVIAPGVTAAAAAVPRAEEHSRAERAA